MPSSTRTAEASVEWSNGKYRRFARNVICPASAYSIPATPRISSSGGPSKRHPNFCAISASFMEKAPQSFARLPASLAQAKEGSTAGPRAYSLKRRGWDAAAAAAGFRRATPTTPRTVTSVSAARGTKILSVEEFRSGDVICSPLSRSDSKSLGTTPSSVQVAAQGSLVGEHNDNLLVR